MERKLEKKGKFAQTKYKDCSSAPKYLLKSEGFLMSLIKRLLGPSDIASLGRNEPSYLSFARRPFFALSGWVLYTIKVSDSSWLVIERLD